MSDDLINKAEREMQYEYFSPSVARELMDAVEANAAALIEAQATIARLEGALRQIADGKPFFAYVKAGPGGIDLDAPGSPFDRGKAEGYEELQAIARAALSPREGEGA